MTGRRVLGDRYEVSDLLGYGGMAEVLLGRDLRLDRDVAVKILRSDLARDHTFQARFRREAQAAAALSHPAIVAVYDTGTDMTGDTPTPYIVMEYVEVQTLRDLLRSEGPLDARQAMQITAEMCGALDFSHRNGIVHRDVKPGNVMITPAGRVKVMDFGIARAVSETTATMTATAAVIGTAQYLSPEQARGESVDARSDVYAAGCVLYELVTGEPPFVGDSPVAVAYQHVREIPKPPSDVNPEVPRELDAIALKALSKNPANRYQSAAAMQADLDRALTGRKVQATPLLTEEEATRVVPTIPPVSILPDHEADDRGRRGWLWVLVGIVVIGAIVAAFAIVSNLGGSDEPKPVAVPSLRGMTLETATAELESAGLALGDVTAVVSSVDETGKVISQDPSSSQTVPAGSEVNLEIGSGPAQTQVPPLTGLSKEDAEQTLAAAGLVPNFIEEDNPAATGTVTRSSPPEGSTVVESSTVTVFISTGQVSLPNVIGQPQADAIATLNAAGFTNVQTSTEEVAGTTAGNVIKQEPGSGKAPVSTTITLIIAVEPPPPPPTTSEAPPTTTSESPTPTAPPDNGGD